MIISILFAPFYLAIGNLSGLTSQIMNFVQLNNPILLSQSDITGVDGGKLYLCIGHTNNSVLSYDTLYTDPL